MRKLIISSIFGILCISCVQETKTKVKLEDPEFQVDENHFINTFLLEGDSANTAFYQQINTTPFTKSNKLFFSVNYYLGSAKSYSPQKSDAITDEIFHQTKVNLVNKNDFDFLEVNIFSADKTKKTTKVYNIK